MNKQH